MVASLVGPGSPRALQTTITPSTTALAGDNPLKSDAELAALLRRLPTISKYKYFTRWKKSFLERLLPHIAVHDKSGMQVADEASDKMDHLLTKTAKQAHKVVDICGNNNNDNHSVNNTGTSVKATLALRELGTLLSAATKSLEEWIPATAKHEKLARYTKFHLGAALIQQGFPQYVTLQKMQDALEQIKNASSNSNNNTDQLPLQAYATQVQRFVDVMADLGMYEIMKKCLEFAVAPENEESSDEEAMEITLEGETMDGQELTIAVQVEPSETMETLLDTIQGEFGIPPAQLVLALDNTDLAKTCAADQTLGKAGIQDGDTLRVGLRKIPLVVQQYDGGKQIPIQVTCRNTLQDVKDQVHEACGMAPSDQRLFRKSSSPTTELTNNTKTVQDYGFVDHEQLYLEPKSICLKVDVPELDQSIDLELGLDDTSKDIQAQIAQKTGLDLPQFTTVIQKTNQALPANETVRDMKLQNGDALQVGLRKISLVVHQYGYDKEIPVQVTSHHTLQDIKDKAENVSGISSANQLVFRKSAPATKLTDHAKTVQEYGFVEDEHLYLEPDSVTLKVNVPEVNKSFGLELGLDDTTKEVQAQIAQQTGLDLPQFATLIKKTQEVLPANQTIRDLKLQNSDVLNVKLNKIPITVKQKAGGATVAELMVHPINDTLGSIKELVRDASGVEPARQILIHNGTRLDAESQTVHDMGLKPQSVLYMDTGPVEIDSSGEIFVSFRVRIKDSPSDREYNELAKVTQDFYGRLLKKKYGKCFVAIAVNCHKTEFGAGIPSIDYNVYVEWAFKATFDSSDDDTGSVIPTRHSLCTFLVKADLGPYLTKVGKMSTRSFSKAFGVYTQQVHSW